LSWIRRSPPTPGGLPPHLELEFLNAAFALVLDAHIGIAGHEDALAGHLDGEALAAFHGIGQSAQLGDEIFSRISFLDVAPACFS
jgi:hypothetical protein